MPRPAWLCARPGIQPAREAGNDLFSGEVLRAEYRLLVRYRRQRPGTSPGQPDVGVNMDVDQVRLPERDGVRQRAFEILGFRD